MRQLPYPSATKTRPPELIAGGAALLASDHGLDVVDDEDLPLERPVLDGWPGRPSVIGSFPSGVHFRTVWSPLSTVQSRRHGRRSARAGW